MAFPPFSFLCTSRILGPMNAPVILPFNGMTPAIDPSAYIAQGVVLTGDVTIGPQSSVWFNSVLRGDVGDIKIGARSNVQDGSILHMTSTTQGTYIGDDVTIGHMALLHSCTIENECLVGMQSCILDDARMETQSMLAAGSLLTPGKIVPSHQLWAGRPARYVRDLTPEEITFFKQSADNYVKNAAGYL